MRYVVGAPVWDRAWSLPLWFDSVEANVPKAETGLVFVVPPTDQTSRDVIRERSEGFAFCEVLRDKHKPFDREHRGEQKHTTLAAARNQILVEVNKVRPEWYISWDSDLLIAPGVVEIIAAQQYPICTVWTWLNRQAPEKLQWLDEDWGEEMRLVQWQEPMQATAMEWHDKQRRAHHLPGESWDKRTQGFWETDVVLGFQMMQRQVYRTCSFDKHIDGEDIPFNLQLEANKIPRWVYGEQPGVHLYTLDRAELEWGYPEIMGLADQKPLAATHKPATPNDAILGFYPIEEPPVGEKVKR